MANFSFYQTVDMTSLAIWYGTVTSAGLASISLQDNAGDSATYYGSFSYSATGLIGGAITGFNDYQNNSLFFKVRNASLDAVTAFNYLNNGNVQGLLRYALSGNDNIIGSAANDILVGGKGENTLSGGGDDTFLAQASANTIKDFGLGADVLQVSAGAKATAILQAAWSATPDTTNAGNATFVSTGYALDLIEASGSHGYKITNTAAPAVLTGSAYADTLVSGANNDTLTGSLGNDTFVIKSVNSQITDLGQDADNLQVRTGAIANATIFANWTAGAVTHNAGEATLTSVGFAVNLAAATGSHGFTVINTGLATSLTGSAFADILQSGMSSDNLTGGGGKDTFSVNGTNVAISDLGKGADVLQVAGGSSVNATVLAAWTAGVNTYNHGNAILSTHGHALNLAAVSSGNGFDLINTGPATTLKGSMFADALHSGVGHDTLTGGAGSDTFVVWAGGAKITDLGNGADSLQVNSVHAKVQAKLAAAWVADANTSNIGNVSITSHGFTIDLAAATGKQGYKVTNTGSGTSLTGSNFADTLIGGTGNDTLNGGQGNDVLTGGGGKDVFTFTTLNCLETITDFVSSRDNLQFSAAVYSGLGLTSGPISADQFYAAAGAVTANGQDVRFVYNTSTGALYYVADGDAAAPQEIAILGLTHHPLLQYGDIVVGS